MTFVVLDENGCLQGSYPDGVWSEETRPAETQEVSQVIWEHLLQGGRYLDNEMLQPLLPELSMLKQLKQLDIDNSFNTAVAAITSIYPLPERETFYIQETEARAYVADNTASVPFIETLANEESMTLTDKAAEIIIKADLFRTQMALAVGRRHHLKNQIDTATTDAELTAISWSS